MNKNKIIFSVILSLMLLAIIEAMALMVASAKLKEYRNAVVKSDTVTVVRRDTVRVEKPVSVAQSVAGYVKETLVFLHDTVAVNPGSVCVADDSVVIPIERKEYKDSNYYAVVSGYRPSLDYIETYNRTVERTVTNTVEKKKYRKVGIGLQAGYGYGLRSKVAEPYVGIGVSVYPF